MQEERAERERLEKMLKRIGLGKLGTPAIVCAAALLIAVLIVVGIRFADGHAESFQATTGDGDALAAETKSTSIEPDEPNDTNGTATESSTVIVDICGCVSNPGVYELDEGMRVVDVVEMAGGVTGDADTTQVNLARKLVDGEQVYIPAVGEAAPSGANIAPANTSVQAPSSLVNINTGSASDLMELPGIGEVMAGRIVDDREKNGPFEDVEDIKRVSGIGDAKFEGIRDLICV